MDMHQAAPPGIHPRDGAESLSACFCHLYFGWENNNGWAVTRASGWLSLDATSSSQGEDVLECCV